MTPDDYTATATRLCSACGMCCNGVMFDTVRLQAGDSAPALKALGLHIKHKRKQIFFPQPCPALREGGCAIYASRPTRCRQFECRQLLQVRDAEISEMSALEKIRNATQQAGIVSELLWQAGSKNLKKSLATRYEAAIAQPIDATSEPTEAEIRQRLEEAWATLGKILQADFRTVAVQAESQF